MITLLPATTKMVSTLVSPNQLPQLPQRRRNRHRHSVGLPCHGIFGVIRRWSGEGQPSFTA